MEHLDLVTVIMLSTFFGCWRTYGMYSRDWCGIRLMPSVLILNAAPAVGITLIYFKVLSLLSIPMLTQLNVPIYFTAAGLAELVTSHFRPKAPALNDTTERDLPALPVIRRITRKKLFVANRLQQRPDCRELLEDAIETSDLSRDDRIALRRRLTSKPSRAQIFGIINAVGLAHIKTFV